MAYFSIVLYFIDISDISYILLLLILQEYIRSMWYVDRMNVTGISANL